MKILFRLSLAGLIFLAACNYPGRPTDTAGRDLQRTLDALGAQSTLSPATIEAVATAVAQPSLVPPPGPSAPPSPPVEDGAFYHYTTQSGDSLPALAQRFDVPEASILSPQPLPPNGFIDPGLTLTIPNVGFSKLHHGFSLPDSEVVNSPTSLDFDIAAFVAQANGPLSSYQERVLKEILTGAQIVERVALESSINPRLLLAWIELRSGWVSGSRPAPRNERYPIGFAISNWEGLYKELVISATHLNAGYYGWRAGSLVEDVLPKGERVRLAPELNAGAAALGNLLARLYDQPQWAAAMNGPDSLPAVYADLFGDPWERAARLGPILPPGLSQPPLNLPITSGERWSFTGGPHASWKTGSPLGAIDLAPVTGEGRCIVSRAWALAPAAGVIARSARNVVTVDVDGDGFEQTGWVILFLHLADSERISAGVRVQADDRLGHPSCEGGVVTGTHMHIARKYNGEWLPAGPPLPMNLGGWVVYPGPKIYQGEMRNGEQSAVASPVGPRTSIIVR